MSDRTALHCICQVVLDTPDTVKACDIISEHMGSWSTLVVDWRYYEVGAVYAYPSQIVIPEAGDYKRHDFLWWRPFRDNGKSRLASAATLELCVVWEDESRNHVEDRVEDLVWRMSYIVDWSYLKLGGQSISPTRIKIPGQEDYQRDDAFDSDKITIL